jgi:hypothetical protein
MDAALGKAKGEAVKYLELGMFSGQWLALCLDPLDWRRDMRRGNIELGYPEDLGAVTPFDLVDDHKCYVVTFDKALRTYPLPERIGVIAHEATHVWQCIEQEIGEYAAGDEIEAHAVQWITKWLTRQLQDAGWLR